MAKFYGKIGYLISQQTSPGIWEESYEERSYRGDVLHNVVRFDSGDKIVDAININNRISIIADSFAKENFSYMKYVELAGVKWRITNIEIQYPRLLLTLGGIYNE